MKAFTSLDITFRQIKDEEVFEDWEKIQQYLNSDQGEAQIKRLGELRQFCELNSKLCDRETLLGEIRRKLFGYTISKGSHVYNIDMESPRVKNVHLKPIFCLAYFAMTYVTI